ncbi:MAG: family 16 glycosylhydrolase, partial [Tannerellaceae bacterium]|nr:family 16 glycosylhydrolase [Tannerellaceae bacterium]
ECGEIEIMEKCEWGGIASGTTETQVNTAIHYGTDNGPGHRQEYYSANVENSLQDSQYHTWALDWTENSLTVSIDNVKFYSFDISKASGR